MGLFARDTNQLLAMKGNMPCPSQAVPEAGQEPKVPSKEERENPRNYNGPNSNFMQYRIGNIPFISWMSNHFYVYGGAGFTSMEAKEYNFGSVKPGNSVRFAHDHIEQPTSASKCWKEKFALMMCARELNSEVATTGPCSEEAYWYGRCRAMESDVDLQRNSKIVMANAYFGDWGDAYNAQKYENNFGWNRFGFSGQKGGVPNPGRWMSM